MGTQTHTMKMTGNGTRKRPCGRATMQLRDENVDMRFMSFDSCSNEVSVRDEQWQVYEDTGGLVQRVWMQDWAREVGSPRFGGDVLRRRMWSSGARRSSELQAIVEHDGSSEREMKRY